MYSSDTFTCANRKHRFVAKRIFYAQTKIKYNEFYMVFTLFTLNAYLWLLELHILSWMTKRNLVLFGPWFMRVKRIEWSWTFTTTFSTFFWRKIWSWGRRRGRALWSWCSRGRQRSWGSWMKRFKEWLWLGDCWPSLISLWCWTGAPRRVSGLKRLSENAIIEIILNFDSL